MPPKVKGLLLSLITATLACGASTASAQQEANAPAASGNFGNSAAGTADIAQTITDKLIKVRAMIAARQLPSAIAELEKIKKEMSGDDAVQSVVRTMLIGVYLEQSNHERAKELLTETFERSKNRRDNPENGYPPIAGQVIRSAYSQLDRYKKLGFNLTDTNLPVEVNADLDRWRKLLETICEQTRELSLDERKTAESLMLLEEAAEARGALARDEYEVTTWRNTVADTREMIANAQTTVTDVDGRLVDLRNVAAAVNSPKPVPSSSSNANANNQINTLNPNPNNRTNAILAAPSPTPTLANNAISDNLANTSPAPTSVTTEQNAPRANNQAANTAVQTLSPTVNNSIRSFADQTPPETLAVATPNSQRSRVVISKVAMPVEPAPVSVAKTEPKATETEAKAAEAKATEAKATEAKAADKNDLMQVGSLAEMATRKINPIYPSTARNAHISGIIKANVVVNEQGSVEEVKIIEGPEFLRSAASYALLRWKFRPATRNGQPVRMAGYINFKFDF